MIEVILLSKLLTEKSLYSSLITLAYRKRNDIPLNCPMIICGSWFYMENEKKTQENKPQYKVPTHFSKGQNKNIVQNSVHHLLTVIENNIIELKNKN